MSEYRRVLQLSRGGKEVKERVVRRKGDGNQPLKPAISAGMELGRVTSFLTIWTKAFSCSRFRRKLFAAVSLEIRWTFVEYVCRVQLSECGEADSHCHAASRSFLPSTPSGLQASPSPCPGAAVTTPPRIHTIATNIPLENRLGKDRSRLRLGHIPGRAWSSVSYTYIR